ncbi:Putative asparagine synthetase [Komagataella phaffii CBS 7435]|uniref:Glutamine amidotransferase type-2 domain-containing protein n=2 Tax=Komagataella phaffii TaxID=460519 RepID=C4R3U2_KOMPG|nr:uncharacterized protein PAS_chr3_0199 [Komagataella phaffii GS115]AOA63694.1 GQ67_03238T0 [Komagataella phaffii]CAH2450034.1 Putative asparagine synthetase [Komagataella phaffii CBS 7435]AOA68813.1 GQ68_03207T0 [Komagataella phaffii GS115]CAY70185.1 Putative protein of unknown function with similarity to asparagine synthetases [Komagataella phaffii GS115]CCA39978.1 Putative asparagine synthetase [Komagataella phaffii CBS 7435]
MCGILLRFSRSSNLEIDNDYTFQSAKQLVSERGTDYQNLIHIPANNGVASLYSSVLSIRSPFTQQPLRSELYTVQFNGELYNKETRDKNDGHWILELLNDYDDIFKVVGTLEGEFAYTILAHRENKIYFGKDQLGKKSLAYTVIDGTLYISSCIPDVPTRTSFHECKNLSMYIFDMETSEIVVLPFKDNDYFPKEYSVSDVRDIEIYQPLISQIVESLTSAVCTRTNNIHTLNTSIAKYAILFSGGIDCSILASLAAKTSPAGTIIDLLNVSFYNPRTKTLPQNTPDRKLGIQNWENLRKMYPSIRFQLVEVDVTYEEYMDHKEKVKQLIYPNDTEMDLSIAIAFYFASRGKGFSRINANEKIPYESTCKVLLSGLGADELFGGYTRHERFFTPISNIRKKQDKSTVPETVDANLYHLLQQELQKDLSNLWIRNLSRDDKVIACWSKEVRYPFLDTHFINYATSVPLSLKLHYDPQSGDITRKWTLRHVADQLDMGWVSNEAKRAIQFGAKSAKMEAGSGKMKGTDKLA